MNTIVKISLFIKYLSAQPWKWIGTAFLQAVWEMLKIAISLWSGISYNSSREVLFNIRLCAQANFIFFLNGPKWSWNH